MAIQLQPMPNTPVGNGHEWRDWFFKVWSAITGAKHNDLADIQGGNTNGYYHLTPEQANAVSSGITTSFVAGAVTVTVTNGIITDIT